MPTPPRLPARRKAGALIVAIVMTVLLLAVAGVSLTLVTTNRRITDAHFTYHAMTPVAERGIDQAMKVINRYLALNKPTNSSPPKLVSDDPSGSWEDGANGRGDNWKSFTNDDPKAPSDSGTYSYFRDFGSIPLGEGRNANLKVKVLNVPTMKTDMPFKTYAVAEVSSPSLNYNRQFLASFSANSPQAPGMVSMQLISFTGGNVFIAAYDSRFGAPNASYIDPVTGQTKTNLSSDVTVATFYAKDLDLGQVNIFGFVSTIPDTEAYFARNAHIWDVNSNKNYQTSGVDGYDSAGKLIEGDPSVTPNILDNFTLNPDDFKPRTNSDIVDALKTNGYSLAALPPKTPANTLFANNKGELFLRSDPTTPISTIDASSVTAGFYYMDSSIAIKSTSSIAIKGKVTLYNRDNPGYAFDASGQGNLLIQNTTSSFSIYSSGDVTIGGNAVMGATGTTLLTSPAQFLVSGITKDENNPVPSGQSITFNGNGAYIGMIYAPTANLSLKGGGTSGTLRGSVVAYTISANGVTNFYYDKNLSNAVAPQLRLGSITELSGDDKISM